MAAVGSGNDDLNTIYHSTPYNDPGHQGGDVDSTIGKCGMGTHAAHVIQTTAKELGSTSTSSRSSNLKVTAAKVVGCVIVAALVGAGIAALAGALPGTEGISIYNTAPTPLEATATALIGVGVAIPIGIGIGKGGEALGMSIANFYRTCRSKSKVKAEQAKVGHRGGDIVHTYMDHNGQSRFGFVDKNSKFQHYTSFASAQKAADLDPSAHFPKNYEVFEDDRGPYQPTYSFYDEYGKRHEFSSLENATKYGGKWEPQVPDTQVQDTVDAEDNTPDYTPHKIQSTLHGHYAPNPTYFFYDSDVNRHDFPSLSEALEASRKHKSKPI